MSHSWTASEDEQIRVSYPTEPTGALAQSLGVTIMAVRSRAERLGVKKASTFYLRTARSAPEPAPVPGARWIPLTRGKFALVDESDYARVAALTWQATKKRDEASWYARHAHETPDGKIATALLHRFILGVTDPAVPVDHVDGNGLNNRRQNLRVCTTQQNGMNRRANRCAKSSRFKGVCWIKKSGAWRASIKTNGRVKYLGLFADETAAAQAYDAAARVLYGEFARLNFPSESEVAA